VSTTNLKTFFNFGIGIVYNPFAYSKRKGKGGTSETFGVISDSLSYTYLDEGIFFKSKKNTANSVNRKSLAINIGFSSDFYTDKKKYLFSASIFYVRSFNTMAGFSYEYVISDHGIDKKYVYSTSSNGSGIYFQLSRRIQFKTWKDKLKKNELGLPQLK
jgi:hypothetical protein